MNRDQYNDCVSEFSDALYRFITKQMRDPEEAKNVVQDTFAILWEKRDSVEYSTAKSYLFTVGYRRMIDIIRKNQRVSFTSVDESGGLVTPSVSQAIEINDVLEQAMNELSEVQRSIVLLRDAEGYSYKEIGDILDLNASQVKVYLFRARKTLKERIIQLENYHGNK